jgi:hypothetical protein
MFLRKYNNTTIQKIKDEKDKLQNSIKERYNFNETLDTIKQAKNKIIKEMTGFAVVCECVSKLSAND